MKDRLESFGGRGSTLVFAHANGYPPGAYRQLLEPLTARCEVIGYRHSPLWQGAAATPAPARANWRQFARDLAQTLEQRGGEPVWMMGHSLGAVVSMLAAVGKPQLFRGLILLDPVFLPSRQALAMAMTPEKVMRRIPLVRKTLLRPSRFSDRQAAFAFHRGKRPFARMSDEALWDYVHAGTRPGADGIELAWSPAWEAAVYSSVPLVWPRLLRLKLPTLGLRGEESDILSAAALQRWGRLQPGAQLETCPGGHLFPLEHPADTAARVARFIAGQGG
ncbi:alpha/beta fold hydrolase [Parahaliea aestuarii]|uniref:Alpha/beta hydrolase n=1 Tax=Parahaliea aestuarii TaxID=1852021 RepID=A0A5C8ZZQ3_9GAMM|nr:alpha/beta hydrolase [Parahaliea aestuarii]TXS93279.1 alpha/beta hydrolase [Parahaliea aestuarii]